jgi:hypothetical protein
MIYNIFETFQEAFDCQHYDHLFQKAQGLSLTSCVPASIIIENNLHIQDENGVFPLDNYILENNVEVEYPDLYRYSKRIWRRTSAWALIYKYQDSFVYRRDHSDRKYNIVDISDNSLLKHLDAAGNEIELVEVFDG